MWGLALRTLRFRAGSFVATFVALCFGATVVMACGGLLETGVRNNAPPQRLERASLAVIGDPTYTGPRSGDGDRERDYALGERVPLDAGMVERVRSVAGVRAVVGERTFRTALIGPDGNRKAQGHAWESAQLTPYTLAGGAAPTGPDEVVLDTTLARRAAVDVGDRVQVAAHGGTRAYRVSGIARPARTVPQATMFFAAAEADRLSAPTGAVADIAIVAAPGTDLGALRKAVSRAVHDDRTRILAGDDRGAVEHPEILANKSDLISLSAVFGGLAVAVAVFVVAGTIGLSVQQRRREFALMRAIGATPRQLRRMLLGETLLVTVLAAGVAWFTGPAAGRVLFDRLVASGMVAETVEFEQGWIPAVAAAGAVLLTALVGGFVGARRAVTAKPTEALAESAFQQRWFNWFRLVLALIALAGATALGLVTVNVLEGPVAASTAGPAVICAAIGLALLAPGLTRLLTWLLYRPLGALTGRSGRIAMLGARVTSIRTAAVVTPIMLAVAISTGELYLQTTTTGQAERVYTESLRADAVVTAAAGGVDPGVVERVRAIPGVASASAYTASAGFVENPRVAPDSRHGVPMQGVDVDAGPATVGVTASAGSLAELHGDTVALPRALARSIHRGLGDTIRLRLGDGASADVRVVALFESRPGYDTMLLPVSLLAPHTTDGLPAQILVRAAEGTDPDRLVASLGAWAKEYPGLRAASRDALLETHAEESKTQAWINYLIIGVLTLYTALSLVNSLILATHNRRREFGLQRLSGATRGQIMRMSAVEATLTTLIGVILGTAAAAAAVVPFSLSLTDSWLPMGSIRIYAAVVGTAAVLTFAATLLPTWKVLRTNPVAVAQG
ncbi:FtsX-like permease family protein [Embleya sp. MST-111070]|uniref:FtsX-like permease family protein n=1 Tax=Embleya sp. MST-111070 TaxID=3398231 RepID=UPI003F733876